MHGVRPVFGDRRPIADPEELPVPLVPVQFAGGEAVVPDADLRRIAREAQAARQVIELALAFPQRPDALGALLGQVQRAEQRHHGQRRPAERQAADQAEALGRGVPAALGDRRQPPGSVGQRDLRDDRVLGEDRRIAEERLALPALPVLADDRHLDVGMGAVGFMTDDVGSAIERLFVDCRRDEAPEPLVSGGAVHEDRRARDEAAPAADPATVPPARPGPAAAGHGRAAPSRGSRAACGSRARLRAHCLQRMDQPDDKIRRGADDADLAVVVEEPGGQVRELRLVHRGRAGDHGGQRAGQLDVANGYCPRAAPCGAPPRHRSSRAARHGGSGGPAARHTRPRQAPRPGPRPPKAASTCGTTIASRISRPLPRPMSSLLLESCPPRARTIAQHLIEFDLETTEGCLPSPRRFPLRADHCSVSGRPAVTARIPIYCSPALPHRCVSRPDAAVDTPPRRSPGGKGCPSGKRRPAVRARLRIPLHPVLSPTASPWPLPARAGDRARLVALLRRWC